ncbi:MAG: ADP-glyceromanno-heptose 6-epimerase [Candidatus Andersenbacteria bacterium]|nr:ADP-glyceromanno-heptose 6-epimerase [bacterium]MDZ4225725.1 ADP-glyceromanno-heptose 6-epimerase [Candidatus Andersenbacteria bacterium]
MKYIITGGAGFIGSALLWGLNERGVSDVLVVDDIDSDDKEINIAGLQYEQLAGIKEFREKLVAGEYNDSGVEAVLHMGACSSTTENDWDYLVDNNVEYSKDIIRWCFDRDGRCVYASSAATYGDGKLGFKDDHDLFDRLKPLNLYGKSKLAVDIWARDGGYLDKVVGLRYFNVFGSNEQHKGSMRSVIAKKFEQVRDKGVIELFKSYNDGFGDGEQERDFVYIKDAVAATLFFMDNPVLGGVFNVGSGVARTWNDVARSMFAALDKEVKINYIDMPAEVKNQYQYHTQADISKLRQAGYKGKFMSLEDAVADYVRNYLVLGKRLEA